jgi:hypothetical protein
MEPEWDETSIENEKFNCLPALRFSAGSNTKFNTYLPDYKALINQ